MAKTVRQEVESLIADMHAKVLTIDDLRATLEVATIARQASIPDVVPDLIPAMARATVLGAWMQYDIRQRLTAA